RSNRWAVSRTRRAGRSSRPMRNASTASASPIVVAAASAPQRSNRSKHAGRRQPRRRRMEQMAEILFEKRANVAWITLNRAERMNAISVAMLEQMTVALREAEGDRDVRVIVMTGAGRGFCSGLDLKDAAAGQGIGGAAFGGAGSGVMHVS